MKKFEIVDEDNDDEMVGSLISRRTALRLFGGAAGAGTLLAAGKLAGTNAQTSSPSSVNSNASLLDLKDAPNGLGSLRSSSALPSCIVRPAQTEGPYFVDEKLNRKDIRSDPATKSVRPGAALRLTFLVSSVGSKGCAPLKDAMVDIWQCDAGGTYSDVQGAVGQKFLRGFQTSDAKGIASFLTIYPGWYPGRTVHIHFKIRHGTGGNQKEFTSQLFFDDTFTDAVYKTTPYNSRGSRNTRNAADGIYRNGGSQLLLDTKKDGTGYAATFDIGLNLG